MRIDADDMSEVRDELIQLSREADATGIKVAVVQTKCVRLKRYPDKALKKYLPLFKKYRQLLDEIATRANKMCDKLWDIYWDDLREKYPELEDSKAKPKLRREDGTEIDVDSITRGKRRRRGRVTPAPKPKKEKFSLADQFE